MLTANEIVAKAKADRAVCKTVAAAGITVEVEPTAPPDRPGLKWIPHQAVAGGPIAWTESEYDPDLPGTKETPIEFVAGLTVYPNYYYTLDGVRKVWMGADPATPAWDDVDFVEF